METSGIDNGSASESGFGAGAASNPATMATGEYLGNLSCRQHHLRSGTELITDAPVDNHGKGQAFSPTDLMGAALASCIVTTMAIYAQARGHELGQISWQLEKHMASAPRRIERLVIRLSWPTPSLDARLNQALKEVAEKCPVSRSLHPDLVQQIEFDW